MYISVSLKSQHLHWVILGDSRHDFRSDDLGALGTGRYDFFEAQIHYYVFTMFITTLFGYISLIPQRILWKSVGRDAGNIAKTLVL